MKSHMQNCMWSCPVRARTNEVTEKTSHIYLDRRVATNLTPNVVAMRFDVVATWFSVCLHRLALELANDRLERSTPLLPSIHPTSQLPARIHRVEAIYQ
jgi:hypothetical protein